MSTLKSLQRLGLWTVLVVVATADQELKGPTFRSSVTQVAVDVQARERDTGHPFDRLVPSDFEITEDELRRDVIDCVYEATAIDLVVVALLNRPASRDKHRSSTLRQLRVIVDEMSLDDRMAVVSFQSRAEVLIPLSTGTLSVAAALMKAMESSLNRESWRIHDAIVAAADLFSGKTQISRRRAVVLVFDRKEGNSRADLERVVTTMLEKDASLYAVRVLTGPRGQFRIMLGFPGSQPHPPALTDDVPEASSVRAVVAATGGDLVTGADSVGLLSDSLERLRRRYRLYFNAASGTRKQLRRIRVSLTEEARLRYPNVLVRAQTSYMFHPE